METQDEIMRDYDNLGKEWYKCCDTQETIIRKIKEISVAIESSNKKSVDYKKNKRLIEDESLKLKNFELHMSRIHRLSLDYISMQERNDVRKTI